MYMRVKSLKELEKSVKDLEDSKKGHPGLNSAMRRMAGSVIEVDKPLFENKGIRPFKYYISKEWDWHPDWLQSLRPIKLNTRRKW